MEMNTDDKVCQTLAAPPSLPPPPPRRIAHTYQELHAIEAELHVELLPGTEIMADVGSHHFVKGAGSQQVLVPQPSDDPHDPLNWSAFWKGCAIIASTWVTFTQGFGPLSLAPMFGDYIEDFHCSLADAVQFTGVAILVLGFSNFFWVPISTSFGRRPVYLFSQLINIGSAIWRARAQTYGSFMGACVLNGFAAGPAETLQPAIIADLFFLHQRGRWNTLYWVAYMGSLMIAPIISGSMAQAVGWRNFWWLYVATLILSFIMVVFMFPETRFHRAHPNERRDTPSSLSSNEKVDAKSVEGVQYEAQSANVNNLDRIGTAARDPYLGRGKPSKSQWRIYQPNAHPLRSMLVDFWTPWRLFAYPIVQFASFVVSWSCSSFLTLNLTQDQRFSVPPYNNTSQTIGFYNFAILVGALIGLATAGPLSDWVSDRATRRNNGVREPEMRLPAMIPYVFVMILGNIVVALGYQYGWPWEAIVIIGYGCAGLQVAALPSISSTYAVDSYKPVAGSLFVSITVNKNVWGYGFSKFITPWIISAGYIPPIMTNMALITLWCLFGILFYYKGKTFRRWSKDSSVHLM